MKPSFSEKDFRQIMGSFPTGVAIVTTRYQDKPIGFTINTLTSVSLNPPLVLFCLGKTRYLYPAFVEAKQYAIHILASDQHHLSNAFAKPFGNPWEDLESEISYQWSDLGCPIISGSLGVIHCHHEKRFNGGDHVIFLNHVDDIDLKGVEEGNKGPLLYVGGKYVI